MSHEQQEPTRPEVSADPRPPAEDHEADWERVLDCGAPGPDHAEPRLFYQAGRRAAAPADAREEKG